LKLPRDVRGEELVRSLSRFGYEVTRQTAENRENIDAKIRSGIAQLDRGEGIPEDHLDAHLAKLKAKTK